VKKVGIYFGLIFAILSMIFVCDHFFLRGDLSELFVKEGFVLQNSVDVLQTPQQPNLLKNLPVDKIDSGRSAPSNATEKADDSGSTGEFAKEWRSPEEAAQKSEWFGHAKIADFKISWEPSCSKVTMEQGGQKIISDMKQKFDPEGDFPALGLVIRWDMAFGLTGGHSELLRASWLGDFPAHYDLLLQVADNSLVDKKLSDKFSIVERNLDWELAKVKLAELIKQKKITMGKINYRRVQMVERAPDPDQSEQSPQGSHSSVEKIGGGNRKVGPQNLHVELLNDRVLTYQSNEMNCVSVGRYRVKCDCF
jgi:hypothetical protein